VLKIIYFFEAGLLSYKSAVALYSDLKRILNLVKDKCRDANFSIYYNELILLNNNVLIEGNGKLTMFVPYTLLGYFITNDEESCKNVHTFFEQQIDNSKPALNFKLKAFPNEWKKSNTGSVGEETDTMTSYREFFQILIDDLRNKHKFTNAKVGQPQSWYSFSSRTRGIF